MLEKLVTKNRDSGRTGVHASDYGKPSLDLFFRFTGVAPTNPPEWYEKLRWGAGLGVEKELLQVLKDSGIVPEEYDQDVHGVIEKEIDGVKITGHMDGNTSLDQTGFPIEIKSINNKNAWDIKKYENNEPRESYVGQLAMYMYLTGSETGYLFVASIDGLNRFFFECKKIGDGLYKCGNVQVDVKSEIARIIKVYKDSLNGVQPDVFEYIYKKNISEIDWTQVSSSDISKARNGHKVIGDYQITYSNWCDKIVQLQGQVRGYTPEEIAIIKQKTEGYTTWNKK
jgi:hypothetical protein